MPDIYLPKEIRQEVLKLAKKLKVSPETLVTQVWRMYIQENQGQMDQTIRTLSDLIKTGNTMSLLEELTTDIDERARLATANRRKRLG